VSAIKAKVEDLTQVMQKVATELYKKAAAKAPEKPQEDVVEAETVKK